MNNKKIFLYDKKITSFIFFLNLFKNLQFFIHYTPLYIYLHIYTILQQCSKYSSFYIKYLSM